ncbi:MAG: DUF4003 domain-containing protein [Butyrivibrio sp.]|nr:DUF4003 domain-containing protein [Butyrivibrio sp.]
MKNEVQRRCELLVENRQAASKASMLENSLIRVVAAASYTEKDKTADAEQLKECLKLLRKKQGIFSDFRGNNELVIAAKMDVSGNPEEYLDNVLEVYKKFQKGKFLGSSYRVLAAASICDADKIAEADAIIDKTNELLKGMKKDHPFLTSDEDTSFAVLLAMKDKSVEDILSELEETYQIIKNNFAFHDNAAYSLSQVLTSYDGAVDKKSAKVLELFDAFKTAGAKYGKEYELASLGVLVNLNMNTEDLVSEVVEAAEFFKGKKGFGVLDMDKHTRLMLGTMIVSGVYSDETTATSASVTSGALAAVIAEQLCMYVAIMAATVTTMNSSN